VRQRDGIFFIRYTAWDPKLKKRRRIEEATDAKNLTEAKQFLDERLGDRAKGLTPAAVSRTRLRELYDDARADYENRKQRIEVLEGRWKHLEAFFGGDELAKRITHPRIQQYIDTRRAEEAAEATIEHEMAALRRMLRLGYKNRKVAQLPVFPTIKGDRVRAVFFEDDEIERLDQTLIEELAEGRNVGNDWLPVFVKVVRWTGMRRNELLRLERRKPRSRSGEDNASAGQHEEQGRARGLLAWRSARGAKGMGREDSRARPRARRASRPRRPLGLPPQGRADQDLSV
jgi:hypothetical protein